MSARTTVAALILSALLAACGGSGSHRTTDRAPQPSAARTGVVAPTRHSTASHAAQALVTAETENRLLVVDLPSGRVARRIALPADPQDLAAATNARGRFAMATSTAAGKVTLLEGTPLRKVKVLSGFAAPHIAEIAPDGLEAYVTDDARGTLTAIDLRTRRVTSTIPVGSGAHHLSFDLPHQLAWVALGESARTIVVLGLADRDHPQVIGRFDPGFPAHDLAFSTSGNRVWVTSADGPDVTVFDGVDEHVLSRVPVGPPPQHVALDGPYAYLTSGYGSTIEQVDAATGRIVRRSASPYGSFELAAGDGYVVTASLERGTLAIYTPRLKLLRVVRLAPATREVALSPPA
jgi:YVTN family beta-propeller protein